MAGPTDPADLRTQNLLRDAEEDLQRERMHLFWQQWGSTIIGMAIMLVVGTALGVIWREWQQSRNERSTAALFATVKEGADITALSGDMRDDHLAMAWLARAASLEPAQKQELAEAYASAAESGTSQWAWLGRWNALRVQMDDPEADPEALLKNYEELAKDGKASGFVALAWLDAAIIAGERLRDPARALDYVAKAEALTPRGTATAALTSDLAHLYEIRKQTAKPAQ